MMTPSIGRIVHVKLGPGQDPVPAIITKVHGHECVNVRIFPDNDGDVLFLSSVLHETAENHYSGPVWFWPPRVQD